MSLLPRRTNLNLYMYINMYTYIYIYIYIYIYMYSRDMALLSRRKYKNINESCRVWMSRFAYIDESCCIYGLVILRIWMSHDAYMDGSWYVYDWVMLLVWMRHVVYMIESCCVHGWVMLLVWMSHVAYIDKSSCIYEWVTLRVQLWTDTFGPLRIWKQTKFGFQVSLNENTRVFAVSVEYDTHMAPNFTLYYIFVLTPYDTHRASRTQLLMWNYIPLLTCSDTL